MNTGAMVTHTASAGEVSVVDSLFTKVFILICIKKPLEPHGLLYMIIRAPYPIISHTQPRAIRAEKVN